MEIEPPAAPHFGGIWECVVKLQKSFDCSFLIWILSSTMCQVEQTVNARPMTPLSDYPNDFEALARNHFEIGRPNISLPFIPNAERYSDLRKALRTSQTYADMIWSREYLAQWNTHSK